MDKGSRVCKCDSCDWTGIFDELVYGEACPRCDDHDVDIDNDSFGFSEDGTSYSQWPLEGLSKDINESLGDYYLEQYKPWGTRDIPIPGKEHYKGQHREWDRSLRRNLITEMDRHRERQEGIGLPDENLIDIAADSALAVNLWLYQEFGGEK